MAGDSGIPDPAAMDTGDPLAGDPAMGPADMGGDPAMGPADGAPDPLFGDAGPAGGDPATGTDIPPMDPMDGPDLAVDPAAAPGATPDMAEPPMDPGMADMHSHMDDAAAHVPGDPGPGTPDPMAGDMDGDGMMPPPTTDDPVDDGMA